MKRMILAGALLVVAAGCGGDTTTSTTAAPTPTTAGTTPTTAATTTTAGATTSAAATGPTDCTEIWPEDLVQEVAGAGVEFIATNADASACTYLGDMGGIALAWRVSTFDDYQEGRTGSEAAAPTVDRDVCDAAYSNEPGELTLIMEAYSEESQRTYTATITGADPEDALAWASELLGSAC